MNTNSWRHHLETEHAKTRGGVNVALQAAAKVATNQKRIVYVIIALIADRAIDTGFRVGRYFGWW